MYSDWKITWREALFSVIIIAILYGLGVWISNPLLTKATEKSQKVITAIKVSDNHKFDHIRRTNAGYFLADGNLIANDTIRMEELPGKYSRVKKVKEEYRTHVETYTTTDGKGHTTTHTRVYHSWDAVKHENFETKSYTFLGQRFTKKEINYSCSTTKDTTIYNKKLWGSDVRYVYYTTPVTVFGVMEGTAADKAYKDLNFRKGTTTKELVERAEKHNHDAPIGFWVLWWIMTAAIVFLFVYCENEWLEDKKKGSDIPIVHEPFKWYFFCRRLIIKRKTMEKPLLCLVTIISLALFGSINANAQVDVADTTSHKEVGIGYFLPEEDVWHPTFMGQDKFAFSKWVKEHQRYPRKAKKAGIQGRVVVGFTIDEKGRMTDVKVVRGVHPLLDKEALRVIKSAPKKWTAGTRNGKSFAFKYTIAVGFGTTGI